MLAADGCSASCHESEPMCACVFAGDCYFAVAGLNKGVACDHALAAARFACALLEEAKQVGGRQNGEEENLPILEPLAYGSALPAQAHCDRQND